MKKLVKESLFEGKRSRKSTPFGELKTLEMVHKYLPFLKDVEYFDEGDRGAPGVHYGEDEFSQHWNFVQVTTGNQKIDDWGVSLLIYQPFDSDEILSKFYSDSVAYIPGDSNDEYEDQLDGIPIEDWTEEDYEGVLKDIYSGFYGDDEDDESDDEFEDDEEDDE